MLEGNARLLHGQLHVLVLPAEFGKPQNPSHMIFKGVFKNKL